MRSKSFSCQGKQVKPARELEINSVVFLLNAETGSLLGPFTIVGGPEDLEKGTWYSSVDEESFSENINVVWESLHEITDAPGKISFLKDIRNCALSPLQTQALLTELEKSPLFSEPKT